MNGLYCGEDAPRREYSWFFNAAGPEQPVCFGGSALPDEYGALYLGSPDDKVIYLTFDAGYDNGNVARTVEILHENEVTGAFFILPEMAVSHSELLLKMAEYYKRLQFLCINEA